MLLLITWVPNGICTTRVLVKPVLGWYGTWFVTHNEFNQDSNRYWNKKQQVHVYTCMFKLIHENYIVKVMKNNLLKRYSTIKSRSKDSNIHCTFVDKSTLKSLTKSESIGIEHLSWSSWCFEICPTHVSLSAWRCSLFLLADRIPTMKSY